MTPRYVWKTVRSDMAREDSQLLMEDMKVFIIVKSPLVPRSVCALTRPHKMQYQLLRRSSETCKAATPYDACQWLGKELTCQELNRVTITESGNHETFVREPRQPQVTPRLKDYGREMASQGLRPARIRMNITRSPYTKKTLHQNDDHDEILGQIEQLAYGPEVSDTSPFSFGHRVYLPELGRSREVALVSAQMGSNYARMETEGQPEGGWSVDVTTMSSIS
ncbi:hypothetical protein PC121_g7953 [Phytophthora cactorum]|nr:hypothetical protein PC121_g7953 [Phytophthora cactorum]